MMYTHLVFTMVGNACLTLPLLRINRKTLVKNRRYLVTFWNRCGISGTFMVLSRPSWGLHSGRRTTVRWVGGRPVQLEFGWDGPGICKQMQKASKVVELFDTDLTWSSWWIDCHTDVSPFKCQFMSICQTRFFSSRKWQTSLGGSLKSHTRSLSSWEVTGLYLRGETAIWFQEAAWECLSLLEIGLSIRAYQFCDTPGSLCGKPFWEALPTTRPASKIL